MKLQNDLGEIRISSDVFTAITGSAATNCYGVKGMAVRSKTDGLVHLLKRESMAKGVKVYYNEDGTVSIELHIIVENGVNLMAVCRSIMSEVRYVVSKTTGVEVRSVEMCIRDRPSTCHQRKYEDSITGPLRYSISGAR